MVQKEKSILIVDDDETILRSIRDYLALKGYDVETAKTGKEAIEKSNKHFFNLAILDIKLPDMDGTELLTKIHDTEPRMVKIILTGYGNFGNAVDSVNKRANAYLVKPIEPKKLLEIIEKKLNEQDEELRMDRKKLIAYMESRDKEPSSKKHKIS